NAAIGVGALNANTTGTLNTAIGSHAMQESTTGSQNVAVGNYALYNNTSGGGNVALGGYTLYENHAGLWNSAMGYAALRYNLLGSYNTASGYESLGSNISGSSNTGIGIQSLFKNTSGNYNLAAGAFALYNNLTGSYNTAFGFGALNNNTYGNGNIVSGAGGMASNSEGSYNVVFGANALGSNLNGDNNIAIGVNAAYATRSRNSTFIGANTYGAVDISNATAIGNEAAVLASNQVRIGNAAVTSIGGQVEWTTLSDGRFKANVSEDVPGLAFINKLRPVTYTLDVKALDVKMKGKNYKSEITTGSDKFKVTTVIKESPEERSAKEARAKVKYTGFVAQEVEEAAKKLDYDFSGVDAPKNEEDLYGIRYSAFVVPLVKSVQEQQKLIEAQEQRINELTQLVNKLLADKGIPNNSNIRVSSAYLVANAPNPFNSSTIISYHIPENASSAKLVITNMKGQVMKTTVLNGKGDGQVTLNAGTLAAGSYNYSLWIGNEQVDTKQMLIVR
ncbi:MAG TPA: tail fiber domain-containing protein, partial [Chitinophagaceae bacterium]|nr:tail fiber domain-containing protein [Chitinophagaceae bacterium]